MIRSLKTMILLVVVAALVAGCNKAESPLSSMIVVQSATFSIDETVGPKYDFKLENRSGRFVSRVDVEIAYYPRNSRAPSNTGQVELDLESGINPDEVRELFHVPVEGDGLWRETELPDGEVKITILEVYGANGMVLKK